jgi:hypothetical protein
MTVDMLPGRGLETAVAVGGRTAIDTPLFIVIVLMQSVEALGTAIPIGA